ncbi:hypothetical protein BD410DRAFT_883768 [Rickenella mellea]|uniref:CLASP N-terminal domain-containing protein n=1 Tax=Rickenella mellea TaxID=50990 RepID=A0A4Y7PPB1_9AGAM|nr:hypothetical protein BD410DRAFT_883768 [Rickenella mellea]
MAPKIPSTIQCNSPEDLDRELRPIREILALEETEETWDKISNGILLLTAVVKGGACSFPKDLVASIKLLSRPINRSILSERSRLSGTAVDLIAELATGLQHTFEPLLPLFLPQLLALATRSSKLSISRAKICILAVLENTQLPSILGHLHVAVTDKSVSLRIVATESVLACMNCFNPPDLETQARAEDIEAVIRTTARDANADVRRGSRKIFEAYKILLPGRVDAYVSTHVS